MLTCAAVAPAGFHAFGFDGGGEGRTEQRTEAWSRAPCPNTFVKDNPNWAYLLFANAKILLPRLVQTSEGNYHFESGRSDTSNM